MLEIFFFSRDFAFEELVFRKFASSFKVGGRRKRNRAYFIPFIKLSTVNAYVVFGVEQELRRLYGSIPYVYCKPIKIDLQHRAHPASLYIHVPEKHDGKRIG